jgi:hypothetical protein
MSVRLFLSYARTDDEAFVRRLYDGLTASGFDVWFDRASTPRWPALGVPVEFPAD